MNRNNALKKLVLAALFVALDLLFTRVFCVYLMGGAERVSLQTLASAAVSILWGLLLNSFWLSFYMGKNFWAWTVAKAPLKLVLVPVFGYLIYLTLKGLQKSGLPDRL